MRTEVESPSREGERQRIGAILHRWLDRALDELSKPGVHEEREISVSSRDGMIIRPRLARIEMMK